MTGTKRLINKSTDAEVASRLEVADSFLSRTIGLLGKRELPAGDGLWIKRCTSIHTCFMRFAIDAVFVDRSLVVKAVYRDLPPWRMTWPAFGASSVFELPAGTLRASSIKIGDQLYVGD